MELNGWSFDGLKNLHNNRNLTTIIHYRKKTDSNLGSQGQI